MNDKIFKILRVFIYFTTIVSTVVFSISFGIKSEMVWKTLSTISVVIFWLLSFYINFLWRIKFLNFLKIPNIGGTYEVINCTQSQIAKGTKKKGKLIVKQKYLDIKVEFIPDDGESKSSTAGFGHFENIDNSTFFHYLFTSIPTKQNQKFNPIKFGVSIFPIFDGELKNGNYYTNLPTYGEIIIKKKYSKKRVSR